MLFIGVMFFIGVKIGSFINDNYLVDPIMKEGQEEITNMFWSGFGFGTILSSLIHLIAFIIIIYLLRV